MMMQKLYVLLLIVVAAGCMAKETQNGLLWSSWEEASDSGTAVLELAYVPSEGFSYEDEDGKVTGVTIEIFRDFVRYLEEYHKLDVQYQLKPVDRFSDFYHAVREGRSGQFGVANVTITDARKEELAFSPPYMSNIAVLITHRDVEEISSIREMPDLLSDHKALAFGGTLHEVRLRNIVESYLPDVNIEYAESNREIIERAGEMPGYFAYVDLYNYWRAAEAGTAVRRHGLFDESSEQFGMIMPHGSDWADVLNQFFESDGGYLNSDRYRLLMETHLGRQLADLLISQHQP